VHDEELIPFLAAQAWSGLKCDKTLKKSTFNKVGAFISAKYGTDFSGPNISNHVRCLKNCFDDMLSCFGISGAG